MTEFGRYLAESVFSLVDHVPAAADLAELYAPMREFAEAHGFRLRVSQRDVIALATSWTQTAAFAQLRLIELFGGRPLEHNDDYVLAMIGGLGGRFEPQIREFMLRHDHELRDGVFWRVFEVEGGGEISLTNIDKYSPAEDNWHNTVVMLARDGTLSRRRVLRSCLEALNRDFSAYRAGWFSRVYSALSPTPAEAAADQDLLRLTLGCGISASVSVAVTHLATVHKAGLLDAGDFAGACAPALTGPKGTALKVLAILRSQATDTRGGVPTPSPTLPPVAEVIAAGCANPHPDVQRAAVAALIELGREDIVRRETEWLAPAVAAEVLAGRSVTVGESAASPPPSSWPPQTDDPGGSERAVPEAAPVQPWSDDDARERYAALLEDSADVIEFELALGWLATTSTAHAVLAPLAARARTRLRSWEGRYPAALLLAALDPEFAFLAPERWQADYPHLRPREEETSPIPSFVTRLREVSAILQRRAPRRPLLAVPTDTHGWIDPQVLASRLRVAERDGVPALPADATQAALRLGPDPGDAARELGLPQSVVTADIDLEWRYRESKLRDARGNPECGFWDLRVLAADALAPVSKHPALIPSGDVLVYAADDPRPAILSGEIALVHPASTLPLVAASLTLFLTWRDATRPLGEEAVLDVLLWHPGRWTPATVQVVALGMTHKRHDIRVRAAELLVAAVPARIDSDAAATGFAACAPHCVLTRWAEAFADAATLAPGLVIELLTALLPRLDRTLRGIGALLGVLLDESIRSGRAVTDPDLRAWLSGFKASSAVAKTARRLLGCP